MTIPLKSKTKKKSTPTPNPTLATFMKDVTIASDASQKYGGGIIEYEDKNKGYKYDTYFKKFEPEYENIPTVFEIENGIEVLSYFFKKYGNNLEGQRVLYYCDNTFIHSSERMKLFKEKLQKKYKCKIELSFRVKSNSILMDYADKISRKHAIPEISYILNDQNIPNDQNSQIVPIKTQKNVKKEKQTKKNNRQSRGKRVKTNKMEKKAGSFVNLDTLILMTLLESDFGLINKA